MANLMAREVDEKLLAALLSRREELVSTLGGDPLQGLSLEAGPGGGPVALAPAVEQLAEEYCQLFIFAGRAGGTREHLPPAESVVRGEERFWGASTEAVTRFYQEVGFQLRPQAHEVPDHVSVELDCLALLEDNGRRAQARRFAREHLLAWLPTLIEHVEEHARLPFYPLWGRQLLRVLKGLYGPSPTGPSGETP